MIALYNDVFEFQSTPPVKAATWMITRLGLKGNISIHAAREGGDSLNLGASTVCRYFNPRRP